MTESAFAALPLAAPLQRALFDKGYAEPSPIQSRSIPVLLEGRDLLACAQTGTGKTAAFALPILQRTQDQRSRPRRSQVRALVLTPTRELAVQVAESFSTYGKHVRFRLGLVHGGVSQRPQERALERGLDVLVATPGRLLDLIEQGLVDLSGVEVFVLDEADRMLDMGFIHDVERIADEIPQKRQTLMFSATMEKAVTALAGRLLTDPAEIRIAPSATTADNVEQRVCFVEQSDKRALITALLKTRRTRPGDGLTLVFTRTKHGADRLAKQLNRAGIASDAIHSNKTQAARLKALDRFRDGRTTVLVATDVAARGIDVKGIDLVVNFDLPNEADCYVHRIGRTARAGASGRAVSFCTGEDLAQLRSIERLIRQGIPVDADHAHHSGAVADRYQNGEPRRSPGRPFNHGPGRGHGRGGAGRPGGPGRGRRGPGGFSARGRAGGARGRSPKGR